MRFIIGLVIGIGAALGAASIWDHYAAEGATERATEAPDKIAQSVIDPPPPSTRATDPLPPTTLPLEPASSAPTRRAEPEALPAVFSVATPPSTTDLDEGPASDSPETRSMDLARAQTAAAWTPFHSRASARGFARHLAEKTGVDFTIVKEGPGRYEVVFEYGTDAERREIESRIASVAGTEVTDDSTESIDESNS